MKKLILSVLILGVGPANAGVLPTAGMRPVQPQPRNTSPNFYITANGGYNFTMGAIHFSETQNTGFNFDTSAPTFGGAIGIDFNRPSVRLELAVAHTSKADVNFDSIMGSEYRLGFTTYTLNVIQYFNLTDNLNLDLMAGIGAANLDMTAQYDMGGGNWVSSPGSKPWAFAMNFGVGLDIALTNKVSFVPQLKYSMLVGTMDWAVDTTLWIHNFQGLAGLRLTF